MSTHSHKVAVIVGSLREHSYNRRLARAVAKLAGGRLSCDIVEIGDLPLYNQDFDADYPEVCLRFKRRIEAADAVLIVTPEYNRSMPGVLKNALDIASRPWGSNSFAGKPAAVIGASPGAPGTSMAQAHVDNVMLYLGTLLMGQPEVYLQVGEDTIDMEGGVHDEGVRQFLGTFVDAFVAWIGARRN